MTYSISIHHVAPRALASVRERLAIRDVSSRFRPLLDQVYAAAESGAISLDGQNVFVYHAEADGIAQVELGVGTTGAFSPIGRVQYSEVPAGETASTTHWGDYAALGAAHDAVVSWCRAEGLTRARTFWEVYGHWHDDPSRRRTDVYHLIEHAEAH